MPKINYFLNSYKYFYQLNQGPITGSVLDYGCNYGGFLESSRNLFPEKKTISQRITPKKSRAVMFDSNRYHSASWPSENTRRIININFRVKT